MTSNDKQSLQEYLDQIHFDALQMLRRQVWTGGFKGGAFGILTVLAWRCLFTDTNFSSKRIHLILSSLASAP